MDRPITYQIRIQGHLDEYWSEWFDDLTVVHDKRGDTILSGPVPGRYPPQRGFAWTNGVFAALLVRMIFGIEAAKNDAEIEAHPRFPPEWAGKETRIYLPSYPWPEGVILKRM